ncbi:MAG: hypothetical protein ACKVT1_01175, partial [Dehalococcoidia bacterium]
VARELDEQEPGLRAQYERESRGDRDLYYPKPAVADILSGLHTQRLDFTAFHDQIREYRNDRYRRTEMPKRWRDELTIGDREHVHSRLGHNMIMRVAAMLTRNPPQFHLEPTGDSEEAEERAKRQERWANNLWPALEQREPKRRRVIDNQVGDGLGIVEIYRTGAYSKLDLKRSESESAAQYLRRTETAYRSAGHPYNIRVIDPLSFFWEQDGDEICRAWVEQEVARATIEPRLRRQLGEPQFQEWKARAYLAKEGMAKYDTGRDRPADTVSVIRYVDKGWSALLVDGAFVTEPEPNAIGVVPFVLYEGMSTGSPNRSERFQGVFWGMAELERAVDWLATLELDNGFVLSRPKLVIYRENDTTGGVDRTLLGTKAQPNGEPIDFKGGNVPTLGPGERIVNVTEQFKAHDTRGLRAELMQLIQISGLNPIAQGESPGSDPAGYAINALQSAAQSMYEILSDNGARGDALVFTILRLLIRDELKQPWGLSSSRGSSRASRAEWLTLGPDDVDDSPPTVKIDPLSDVNRIAVQQALRQGNQEGYISRWRVQQDGYGVQDPDAEDEEIAQDNMKAKLLTLAIDEAMTQVLALGQQAAPGPGLVDQFGQPMPSSQGAPVANGGAPAPVQPPTVGGAASGASSAPFQPGPGPASQQPMTALAGQDRGQRPPGVGG